MGHGTTGKKQGDNVPQKNNLFQTPITIQQKKEPIFDPKEHSERYIRRYDSEKKRKVTVLDPELVSCTFYHVRPTIDPKQSLENLNFELDELEKDEEIEGKTFDHVKPAILRNIQEISNFFQ